LGEEEVVLEGAETGDKLLVFQEELEECTVGVGVGVFNEFVEPGKRIVSHKRNLSKSDVN
jgi:hypothetical protein